MIKKSLLVKQCLAASLALHGVALWIFYAQPVILKPVLARMLGKMSPSDLIPWKEEDIDLSEKNIALEEVLNQIVLLPSQWKKPFDLGHDQDTYPIAHPHLEKSAYSFKPLEEEIALDPSEKGQNSPLAHFDILSNMDQIEKIPLTLEEISLALPETPLSKPLSSVEIAAVDDPYAHDPFDSLKLPERPAIYYSLEAENTTPLLSELKPELHTTPSFTEQAASSLSSQNSLQTPPQPSLELQLIETPPKASALPVAPKRRLAPSLSSYAAALSLTDAEWSEDFTAEVKTLKIGKEKYFFSISLKPRKNLNLPELQDNYYFLIDSSSSIEKKHYQTFKRAVVRALHSLKEEDKFNIYVFDNKLYKLSPEPLDYSKEAIAQAEEFLDKKESGDFFSGADLYTLLPKVLPSSLPADDFNIAILLSDGDAVSQRKKQQKKIKKWDMRKGDEIALYTAAVGKDNNLGLLELLSLLNRGSMVYSETYASFPRKVAKLVLDLAHPIAKEMQASVINPDTKNVVTLFPLTGKLPALFQDRPYTIYGTTSTLSNFTLLVQGKNREEMVTIKKEISFKEAKEDKMALRKAWNQEEAHLLYDKYLQEGNLSALEEAEILLYPPQRN